MVIAIDFDGTVVASDHAYADLTAKLTLMPNAKRGLLALKKAGHVLLLYSARANKSLLEDPYLDPLVRRGVRKVDMERWEQERATHAARYVQMIEFINAELPDIFDALDDGEQGKPLADMFIDDRALRYGRGAGATGWNMISYLYGEST